LAIFSVFLISIGELGAGIFFGFLLELNPFVIGVASAIGAIFSAFIIISVGETIRIWILTKLNKPKNDKKSLIRKIWEKYGIIGLGLLSPLLFGTPIGSTIGVALGAPKKDLFLWMSLGVFIWTIILTLAFIEGINLLEIFNK
jgi:hypothetical protein